jgi:hypothetical protein
MSMVNKLETKVTPEVLQTISSIEISEKLGALLDLMQRQVPEGVIFSIKGTATTTGRRIALMFGGTIYNDGDADLYILESDRNIQEGYDTPLQDGENMAVDFRYRGQYVHWLKTLTGTAAFRILAYR